MDGEIDSPEAKDNATMTKCNIAPEFQGIEALVQFCIDDDRKTFMPGEAQKVSQWCLLQGQAEMNIAAVIRELRTYGLTQGINMDAKINENPHHRGVTANNHDRYSEKNGCIGGGCIGSGGRQMATGWGEASNKFEASAKPAATTFRPFSAT